jgi:hypothetical protein
MVMERVLMLQQLSYAGDDTLLAASDQSLKCSTGSYMFCTSDNQITVTSGS